MKWIILSVFIVSTIYIHLRGNVRHRFFRQLSDHSTFFAPLNVFMYLFSRVPNTPYLTPELFPELRQLEQHWTEIRAEALSLLSTGNIKASDKYNDLGFNSFFKTGWKRFYLKWYDEAHPSATALCPRTTELLRCLGTVKAAMFAELPPGASLVRHRDPYAGSLRYHLGLSTPADPACYIDVDGQRYFWRDGEAVIFDETYIHYAKNCTEQDRIILFCDIERPMRYRWAANINHAVGRILMSAASSPNDGLDRTGGLNKAFRHIYRIRLIGKRLKAWNRRVYYLVKWLLFGSILALVFFA